MENRRNYYRILQVQPDAPIEVIKASYRAMMRELKLHPDLGGEHWNAKVLNEAYATLADPKRRAAYDKRLYQRYTKNSQSRTHDTKQTLVTDFCPFCKRPLARQEVSQGSCPNCQSPLKKEGESEAEGLSRRSIARIQKSGKIRYQTASHQKAQEAKLVDLSPSGMRFISHEKMSLGGHLIISCPTLKASAEVVNVIETKEDEKERFSIGVRFLAVTYAQASGTFYSVSA